MINRYCNDEETFRLQAKPRAAPSARAPDARAAREHRPRPEIELLQDAMNDAHVSLDGEATRLKELCKVNANVRAEEIELAEKVVEDVTRHISKAHLRLDAVRLILGQPG